MKNTEILENKHHYAVILRNMDAERKAIEDDYTAEKQTDYKRIVAARNAAMLSLLKEGVPYIETDKSIQIVIDDDKYSIDKMTLNVMLGEEKFKLLTDVTSQNIVSMDEILENRRKYEGSMPNLAPINEPPALPTNIIEKLQMLEQKLDEQQAKEVVNNNDVLLKKMSEMEVLFRETQNFKIEKEALIAEFEDKLKEKEQFLRESSEEKIKTLKAQLEKINQEKTHSSNEIEQLERLLQEEKQQKKDAEKKLEKYREKIKNINDENTDITEAAESKRKADVELAKKQALLEEKKKALQGILQNKETITETLNSEKEKLFELEQHLIEDPTDEFKHKLHRSKSNVQKLKEELSNLDTEANELQKMVDSLDADINTLKTQAEVVANVYINAVATQKEEQSAQLVALQEELQRLKRENEKEKEKALNALEEEKKKNKENIEKLKKEKEKNELYDSETGFKSFHAFEKEKNKIQSKRINIFFVTLESGDLNKFKKILEKNFYKKYIYRMSLSGFYITSVKPFTDKTILKLRKYCNNAEIKVAIGFKNWGEADNDLQTFTAQVKVNHRLDLTSNNRLGEITKNEEKLIIAPSEKTEALPISKELIFESVALDDFDSEIQDSDQIEENTAPVDDNVSDSLGMTSETLEKPYLQSVRNSSMNKPIYILPLCENKLLVFEDTQFVGKTKEELRQIPISVFDSHIQLPKYNISFNTYVEDGVLKNDSTAVLEIHANANHLGKQYVNIGNDTVLSFCIYAGEPYILWCRGKDARILKDMEFVTTNEKKKFICEIEKKVNDDGSTMHYMHVAEHNL